jgi:type III secretory pathway component EscU
VIDLTLWIPSLQSIVEHIKTVVKIILLRMPSDVCLKMTPEDHADLMFMQEEAT